MNSNFFTTVLAYILGIQVLIYTSYSLFSMIYTDVVSLRQTKKENLDYQIAISELKTQVSSLQRSNDRLSRNLFEETKK